MVPRFVVDINVGKLAKWLRILGYDALLPPAADDDTLIRIAQKERRVLLTRDTQMLRRRLVRSGRVPLLLIQSDRLVEQLAQVVKAYDLDTQREFSLCLECNQPLVTKTPQEVQDLVPPYVFRTQTQFMACPSCQRIYWRGTHWHQMKEKLKMLKQGTPA